LQEKNRPSARRREHITDMSVLGATCRRHVGPPAQPRYDLASS